MIIDFLKKYQEELISQKIDIKEELDLIDTKIKEESKFLSILEDNNESYFSVFTPRNVNEKNNNRANEIKQNLLNLNTKQQELLNIMKFYDGRLQEVTSLINNNMVIDRNVTQTQFSDEVNSLDRMELMNNLTNIKSFIFQDPQRAIVEIDSIINSL